MKKRLLHLLLVTAIISGPLQAEFRTWTNTEGVKLEAELVKAEGADVTLRLRNGKTTTFSQSKLSQADQDFIKERPAEPEEAPKTTVDAKRKAKWQTKLAKAKAESEATGLPVLMLFTGSTWCPYCIKLDKAVFAQQEFKSFANQNLVLLMLDYEAGGTTKDKELKRLKEEYSVTGYPTYFLTDASGTKLAQGGFTDGITPASFAEWVRKSVKTGK